MALTLSKIKSKLDGKELDLSMMQLKDVPVKELAAIPKATHLDLSVNSITTIQPNFCTLTHLVRLDLSKNRIQELPEDFGQLENLQHLDLFSNALTLLPESFYNLKSLKWLDLKNNPLDAQLKAVSGECVTAQECHSCAKKVVKFMTRIHEELEKEREKKLIKAKAKAASKQKKVEAKQEKLRQEKKAAKEKRREEALKKQVAEKQVVNSPKPNGVQHSNKNQKVTKDKKNTKAAKQIKGKKKSTVWYWLLSLVVLFFSFLVWRYLGSNFPNNLTQQVFHKAIEQLKVDSYELYHHSSVVGADVAQYLIKLFHTTVENVNRYWQQQTS